MSNQHQSGKDTDHSDSVRSTQGSDAAQKSGNQGAGSQGNQQTPKDGNTEGGKASGPGKT